MPAFTLAGIVLTQLWNLLADRARRRAERAARLDPDKIKFYREYVHACWALIDLDVWPASRTEPATPTAPAIESIRRTEVDIAFAAPARTTTAARTATAAATALAATIDGIRDTTTRPTGGTLTEPAAGTYAAARRALADAVDEFARIARRDIGVTARYLPVSERD